MAQSQGGSSTQCMAAHDNSRRKPLQTFREALPTEIQIDDPRLRCDSAPPSHRVQPVESMDATEKTVPDSGVKRIEQRKKKTYRAGQRVTAEQSCSKSFGTS